MIKFFLSVAIVGNRVLSVNMSSEKLFKRNKKRAPEKMDGFNLPVDVRSRERRV